MQAYLPLLLEALAEQGVADPAMELMARAKIPAETAGFLPIDE
jgi:hypothetical protein